MNAAQAIALRAEFLKLTQRVTRLLPQTLEVKDWPDDPDSETHVFTLCGVSLERLTAHYRRYVGCGEYDHHAEPIDLSTMFQDGAK